MAGVNENIELSQVNTKDSTDSTEETVVADILATLSSFAPNNEVRDCIRKYQPEKNVAQLRSAFSRDKKQLLADTLQYLGVDTTDSKKPEVVEKLIYRIKNLHPKMCEYCNDKYTIDKDDTTLLPCKRCGQDVHRKCLLEILEIEDDENLTEADIKKMLNPFGLPSMHHLCMDCEEYMSTKDLPVTRKTAELRKDESPADDEEQLHTHQNNQNKQNNRTIEGKNVNIDRGLNADFMRLGPGWGSQTSLNSNETVDEPPPICNHYKRGNCKHGRKGDKCQFSHPKPCSKLMKHGNKGPRGCNKGKQCSSFHPIMCRNSLNKGQCYDNECTSVHVKGTSRKKSPTDDHNNNTSGHAMEEQGEAENKENDFLSLFHNFRRDVITQMDTKIKTFMVNMMPTAQKSNPMFPARPAETGMIFHPNPMPQYIPNPGYQARPAVIQAYNNNFPPLNYSFQPQL